MVNGWRKNEIASRCYYAYPQRNVDWTYVAEHKKQKMYDIIRAFKFSIDDTKM